MEMVGLALMAISGIVMLVTALSLLIMAFKESLLWGLGYVFVPFVSLIFVVKFWDKTSKNFLIMVAAWVVFMIGIFMSGSIAEMDSLQNQ